jgi:hypothetical protein
MGLWVLRLIAVSLILTTVLELCFALLYGVRNKKDILLLVLVNMLTNPFVVLTYYLMTYYTDVRPVAVTIILEIITVLTEGYYFKSYGKTYRQPVFFAIWANLFSYCIGRFINMVWIG